MVRRRAAHIFPKEKNGHYVEPQWCSRRLFEEERFGRPGDLILDPACGWGRVLHAAQDAGFKVVGCDVVNRKPLLRGPFYLHNFLTWELPPKLKVKSIVCNPPFDQVEEFCLQALEVARYKVAMLTLLRRLPAAHYLRAMPLETIYFLTPRPSMPPGHWIAQGNEPGGGTQDFVWLVFNKNMPAFNAWPTFRWLHRDEGNKK